ncbi:MAG: hypothetical protein L6R38_009092 [Xanthoria sp. 2 TBL-2021]|nr:MAG: hypothetical protein L6R38_009092 [Xanthoria sp. 2 TBL-2021]
MGLFEFLALHPPFDVRQQVLLNDTADDLDDDPHSHAPGETPPQSNEATDTATKLSPILPATSLKIDAGTQRTPPATPMAIPDDSIYTSMALPVCPKAMPATVDAATQTTPPVTPVTIADSSTGTPKPAAAFSPAPAAPNQPFPRFNASAATFNPSAAAFRPPSRVAAGPSTLTPEQFQAIFPMHGRRGP